MAASCVATFLKPPRSHAQSWKPAVYFNFAGRKTPTMLITVVQKQWYPLLTPHLSSSWASRFLTFCFTGLYPVFSMTTTSQLTFWQFSGHWVRESSCSRTQHSNQRSNFSILCPWQSDNHIFYVLTQNTCLYFHLE